MGSKKRWERKKKAYEKGRQAYLDGKSLVSNPYKKSFWGLGWDWERGWDAAQREGGE